MTSADATDAFLRDVGLSIWAARDTLAPVFQEEFSLTTLNLSNGITIEITASFNDYECNMRTRILRGDDVISVAGKKTMHRAYEAVQAHAILKKLGGDCPIENPEFFAFVPLTRIDKLLRRKPRRDTQNVVRRALMRRIEQKIGAMTVHPDGEWLDIGNGVEVAAKFDRSTWQMPHQAWARTDSHGTVGLFYHDMQKALDDLKARALVRMSNLSVDMVQPVSIKGGSRESEVLRVGHAAVALVPDLVDADGTPLTPLVERHLPELIAKRDDALGEATTDAGRAEVVRHFDEGLDIIAATIEEGLTLERSEKSDALIAHLKFLRRRHPHVVPTCEAETGERDAA